MPPLRTAGCFAIAGRGASSESDDSRVCEVVVFGERLGAIQLAGGALVLGAVLVLHARRPRRRPAGLLAGT
jgi:drug/metabolite transporter (DMT)-like permease